jgi:hypothetical protein
MKGLMQPNSHQPTVQTTKAKDYRESYANSIHVRVSVWDFLISFGVMRQETVNEIIIENAQGIYLSPQQAKALWNVLGQNLNQYEQTFGPIALEPQPAQESSELQVH